MGTISVPIVVWRDLFNYSMLKNQLLSKCELPTDHKFLRPLKHVTSTSVRSLSIYKVAFFVSGLFEACRSFCPICRSSRKNLSRSGVSLATFFFKYWPIPASFSFILVLFSFQHQLYKLKKHRWCPWDSNLGSQYGRRRRNQGAIIIFPYT